MESVQDNSVMIVGDVLALCICSTGLLEPVVYTIGRYVRALSVPAGSKAFSGKARRVAGLYVSREKITENEAGCLTSINAKKGCVSGHWQFRGRTGRRNTSSGEIYI